MQDQKDQLNKKNSQSIIQQTNILEKQCKLREVLILNQESSNQAIRCGSVLSNYPEGYTGNESSLYIPYNVQYHDKGWGCAWRAIQMVLSAYNEQIIDFVELFQKYSRKSTLASIVKQNKILDSIQYQKLLQTQFAPQQHTNNWAQPFICKLVCQDKNIKNKLVLVNGYPNANAPQCVFQEVINFKQFIDIIKKNINFSPIMIDDGFLAMTILAFKQQSKNQFHLIIGDPHILSNKNVKQAGIYEIVLDNQGRLVQSNVTLKQLEQCYLEVVSQLSFQFKSWMVLYTSGLKE